MIDEAAIKARVVQIIDLAAKGNVSLFVRMCREIDPNNSPSETVVRGYKEGKSVPGLVYSAVMAQAAGVSLDWLAGLSESRGEMETRKEEPKPDRVSEPREPYHQATVEELIEFQKWLADPNRGRPASVAEGASSNDSLTIPGFVLQAGEEAGQELVYVDLTLRGARETPIVVTIPGFIATPAKTTR